MKRIAPFLALCLLAVAGYAQQNISSDVRKKMEALSSPDPIKRAAAACALGEMGERAAPAIPYLIALLGDGTPVDQKHCCRPEHPFEDEGWQPDYEEVREPSVGEAATQALIALHEYAMSDLIEALRKAEDWRARKNAAWALAHRGDASAVEALVVALGEDRAWQVRAQAAYALFQRGGAGERVVKALIAALHDDAWQVREQAVMALGHKGSSRVDVVGALLPVLKDSDPRIRAAAAGGLWHCADSRAFAPLVDALRDEDGQVRENAANTLGNRVDNDGIQVLIAALNDENKNVRKGIKAALEIVRHRAKGSFTYIRLPDNMPPEKE